MNIAVLALLLLFSSIGQAQQFEETGFISAYKPGEFLRSLFDIKNKEVVNNYEATGGLLEINTWIPHTKMSKKDCYDGNCKHWVSKMCYIILDKPILNTNGYRLEKAFEFSMYEFMPGYWYENYSIIIFPDETRYTLREWTPRLTIEIVEDENYFFHLLICDFPKVKDYPGEAIKLEGRKTLSLVGGVKKSYPLAVEGTIDDIVLQEFVKRKHYGRGDSYSTEFNNDVYYEKMTQRDLARVLGNDVILKFKYQKINW